MKGFNKNVDEERKEPDNRSFYVVCIDENECLQIFSHKTADNAGRGGFVKKIRECSDFPGEIKDKDLFGMGYPYLVCMYGNKVTLSTDYGICLLTIINDLEF